MRRQLIVSELEQPAARIAKNEADAGMEYAACGAVPRSRPGSLCVRPEWGSEGLSAAAAIGHSRTIPPLPSMLIERCRSEGCLWSERLYVSSDCLSLQRGEIL